MVLLTPAEKERRVKELLEQGKSTREIAEEVHMSFGDIGSIRRTLFGETEAQPKSPGELSLSTDTKVFTLAALSSHLRILKDAFPRLFIMAITRLT